MSLAAGAPLALVLDGAFVRSDRAAFLPVERGLLYGDGLFETLPVEHGVVLEAARHEARLLASCGALGMPPPPPGTWNAGIAQCLSVAGRDAGVVRVTWTRGPAAARSYAPSPGDGPGRLLVAAFPSPPARAEGVRAALVSGLAPGDLARHKTLSAMGFVVAAARAQAAGADEAILLDQAGNVLEAAGSNVFAVRAGRVSTPPATRPILPGIGRARALEALAAQEADLTAEELTQADEVFLTNAVIGAVAVVAIDGRPIGSGTPGAVARSLLEQHRAWRGRAFQSPS